MEVLPEISILLVRLRHATYEMHRASLLYIDQAQNQVAIPKAELQKVAPGV
jgi:hypothetical protein